MGFGIDLSAGAMSGVICAAAEYPFDTVKVVLQSDGAGHYRGYKHCTLEIFHQKGLSGFYSGAPARLAASGVDNALTLGGYKAAMRLVASGVEDPAVWQIMCGGAGGGVATTAVLAPFELIKCRMQASTGAAASSSMRRNSSSINTWHCVKGVFLKDGVMGFYRGWRAMLARDVFGTAIWCGTNDKVKVLLTPARQKVEDLSTSRSIIAGGISGFVYSAAVYPADILKTRMQVEKALWNYSLLQVARQHYKEGGLRSFYRGFGIVAACSMPGSALVFVTFDWCSCSLHRMTTTHYTSDLYAKTEKSGQSGSHRELLPTYKSSL